MTNKIYDIAIIGAGSVGMPTAFFLAERHLKVLVLEKAPSAGQGQNKAAIGGVRATHSDPAKILLCQQSLDIFSTWKIKYGDEIGYKKGGYCFPVYDKKQEDVLKGILPIQKKYKLNIDWVGAAEIKQIVPGINPNRLIGGTYSPDDAQVSPMMSSVAFCRRAEERGANIHFKEEVVEIKHTNNEYHLKTNKDDYLAKKLVLAPGANATAVGKLLDMNLPVEPDSHEAGISAPVENFLEPLVVDIRPGPEGKTSNFYFGQNHEGQIIFCYTPSQLFKGTDQRSTSEFMPIIARRLIDLLPRLKNLLIRKCWRGLYPMTPDFIPIVDRVKEKEGLYLAIGMCGQGFMLGPGVGANLASLICEGKPLIEQEAFDMLTFYRNFYKSTKEALK